MDKLTIIIIAFFAMTYGAVLLSITILSKKLDSLHNKFDKKNHKENKNGR